MNIHFKDKELFENLKLATIAKVKVGSHLYGTNGMYDDSEHTSDEDFLYIYATSENELKSFIWTNHQLQYKEDGIDHNFVSVHSFIRNCLNGDSTINFEVIQSDELQGTKLAFLNENKEAFKTYQIIRSYLGFARRDIKYYYKTKTEYEKKKQLEHIIRGFLYSYDLIHTNFKFKLINLNLKDKIKDLDVNTNDVLKKYDFCITNTRIDLNERLNNNTLGLAKIIRTDDAKIINDQLLDLQTTDYWKEKKEYIADFNMNLFINAFENWVEYENN